MASLPNSTLCLGGSFNPIHNGHIACSRHVAEHGGFDRVLLVPSARPPHKPANPDLASPEHRLAMCHIVAAEDPLFQVTDIEIRRSGPSYTIDTVREFRMSGVYPVNWLIGADMLNYLPRWHLAEQLIDEVNFFVMARPGFAFEWSSLPEKFQNLRDHVVEAPRVDISATEIRRKVRGGEGIDELVPPGVARYIESHRLYK